MTDTLGKRSGRIEWLVTLGLLAALALLAYGPWLAKLGFYRDDWYVLWAGRVHGPESIPILFSTDRPIMGLLYSLSYRLFRENPLAWQIYALFLRWIGAVFTLVIARCIWPARRIETAAAAVLFLVYPGFLQQPNGMTLSNQLTTYALALLSIALTAIALRTRKTWATVSLTTVSLASALLYQLLYEYMVGLEATRLVVLWILAGRDGAASTRRRLRRSFLRWLPYAGAIAINLGWRTFVFESERGTTNLGSVVGSYLAQPLRMGVSQGIELLKDLFEIVIVGWVLPAYQLSRIPELRIVAGALLTASAAIGLILLYNLYVRSRAAIDSESPNGTSSSVREFMVVGAVSLVCSQVPVILALRDAHWSSGFDRYTLQATLGAALLIVGLLWAYVKPPLRRWIVLGLVAVSVGTHFLNARAWAEFWEAQRQLWWQLSWRAPQLQPGTTLLVQMPGEGFYEDYEVWGPANLIYYPGVTQVQIGAEVFTEGTVEKVIVGASGSRGMRKIIEYPRDYEKALVLSRPTRQSCLHVLDGGRLELPTSAGSLARVAGKFSHVEQIDTADGLPPALPPFFGEEPAQEWCYYYQRALLARQRGDWEEASRLADQATALDLKPLDLSEWLPFIEAYVYAGRLAEAGELASRLRSAEFIRHSLCDEISGNPPTGFPASPYEDVTRLLCAFQ